MRGWLHCLVLLLGEAWVEFAEHGLSPRSVAFARWTLVGYFGSAMFHVVPWGNVRSYTQALALDFMTICLGFTGHVGVLTEWRSFWSSICLALTFSMAMLCLSGLLLQRETPLWAYHR